MKMSEKTNTFVKQFIALVKGDDAAALAESTKRKANAALTEKISKLTGDIVDREEAVKETEEALQKAKLNYGTAITSRPDYIATLLQAKVKHQEAIEALEETQYNLDFLKEMKKDIAK